MLVLATLTGSTTFRKLGKLCVNAQDQRNKSDTPGSTHLHSGESLAVTTGENFSIASNQGLWTNLEKACQFRNQHHSALHLRDAFNRIPDLESER
jgi:hypothetical protein